MSIVAENHACGKSKVEVYGWSLKNNPGKFAMIPKEQLRIDRETYQRSEISQNRIGAMARSWSWPACGVLIVAEREDGTFWIVDGQHRAIAAGRRSDIRNLPCMVFSMETIEAEARAFIDANTVRGPMSSLTKYRAQVVAGEASVIAVKKIVEDSGYSVGATGGAAQFRVACIRSLIEEYESNSSLFRDVWLLCVEIQSGKPIIDKMLKGMCQLERHLRGRNDKWSVFDKHNKESLLRAGGDEIMASINKALGYFGKGGAKIWAQGIVDLLNHYRSSRKIDSLMQSDK